MSNEIERRVCIGPSVEIRAENEDAPVLAGYAAVFYRDGDPSTEFRMFDDMIERIMPGAFDAVLASKPDIRGLFNHDSNEILGRTAAGTMRLSVDDVGLRYEIDVPETQTGRDVAESVRRGDISGSSFSFKVDGAGQEWVKPEKRGDPITRILKEFSRIADLGPVTFPAYDAASVSVRSAEAAEHAARPVVKDRRKMWQIKARAATL